LFLKAQIIILPVRLFPGATVPVAEVATRRLKFLEHPGDRKHYFCYALFTKGRDNNKKHTM